MRFVLPSPRHSRHPLVRILASVVALALLGALMVFGLLALVTFAVVGGAWLLVRQWRLRHGRAAPRADINRGGNGVIEGEFVVVREGRRVTQ